MPVPCGVQKTYIAVEESVQEKKPGLWNGYVIFESATKSNMLGVDSFNYGKDFDGEKPEALLLCSYKFTHKHTQGFSKLYIQY